MTAIRIKKIAVNKLGIFGSIFLFVMSLPFCLAGILKNILNEGFMAPAGQFLFLGEGPEWVILVPVGAFLTGYLAGCLTAYLVNLLTRWTGGIEFEIDDKHPF